MILISTGNDLRSYYSALIRKAKLTENRWLFWIHQKNEISRQTSMLKSRNKLIRRGISKISLPGAEATGVKNWLRITQVVILMNLQRVQTSVIVNALGIQSLRICP